MRDNLRTLVQEYSSALEGEGADGYRRSIKWWEPAYRNSAIVQDATLGEQPHDLSEYIDGAGRVARGLDAGSGGAQVADRRLRHRRRRVRARGGQPRGGDRRAAAHTRRGAAGAARAERRAAAARRFAGDLRPAVVESGRTIEVATRSSASCASWCPRPRRAGSSRTSPPPCRRSRASRATRSRSTRSCAWRPAARTRCCIRGPTTRCPTPTSRPTGQGVRGGAEAAARPGRREPRGDANGQWVRVLTSAGDRTVNIGNNQFAQAYRPILGTNPPKPVRAAAAAAGRALRDAGAARPAHQCAGPGDPEVARGLPKTRRGAARYARAEAAPCKLGARASCKLEGLTELRVYERGGHAVIGARMPQERAAASSPRSRSRASAWCVGGYILAHQRLRFPVLEEEPITMQGGVRRPPRASCPARARRCACRACRSASHRQGRARERLRRGRDARSIPSTRG